MFPWIRKMLFWQLRRELSSKMWKGFAQWVKIMKKIDWGFIQKKLHLKLFPWTHWMQLWQQCQIFLRRSRQYFAPFPNAMKKNWIKFFQKFFSAKYFSGHAECSCDPAVKFLREDRNGFVQCLKINLKNVTFVLNATFPHRFPLDT